MQRGDAVLCNGIQVPSRAIPLIAGKPVLRVGLVVSNHRGVAMHLGEDRRSSDRDAVSVRFRSGHHPQGVRKVGCDKVMSSIEEQHGPSHGYTLMCQRQKPLHHCQRQRCLDAVLIDNLRGGFSECVLGKHLTAGLSQGTATLLGDRFGVIQALGPALNIRCPDDEPRDDGAREGATTHLVTPDNTGEALGDQLVLPLECGFYSRDGRTSSTLTPRNDSE